MKINNRGFTIIELMIATAVFSVILLVLTAGILQIGRAYQKAMIQSKTLEVARTVSDDIAQAIQFSGGDILSPLPAVSGVNGSCVGSRVYSYKLGTQLTASSGHVFVGANRANCDGAAVDINNGVEMLGQYMRVTKLAIAPVSGVSGLYSVQVTIAYGDNDLFCEAGTPACSDGNVAMTDAEMVNATSLQCKNIRDGTQFCAVSELNTSVVKRI